MFLPVGVVLVATRHRGAPTEAKLCVSNPLTVDPFGAARVQVWEETRELLRE